MPLTLAPSSKPRLEGLHRLATGHAWVLLLGCFLLSLPSLAQAQKPKITASFDPSEIIAGENTTTTYTLTFEGSQPDEIVKLQLPPQLINKNENQPPAQQNQVGVSPSGRQHQTYTLSWEISATEPGTFIIPAQEFHIGGVPYRSNEAKLVVAKEPASAYDPMITIQVDKTEMYVGELVPITVNLYVHRSSMLRRLGLIEMPKDSFAVQRFPLQGEESAVIIGNQRYRDMIFRSTVAGLKAGKNKLGPASMEIQVDVPIGNFRNDGNPFNTPPTQPRKFTPQCNEIELNVLPLPEEGKPANFSGAVGDFQISGTADPTTLAVGDPIAVDITISGVGNFDAITPPTMVHPEDWKSYPARKYSPDGPMSANTPALNGGELATQRLTFTQVILPKKVMTQVPPFEFSYFSPKEKKYFTLATEAIPLKMTGAPEHPSESSDGQTLRAIPVPEEPEKTPAPKPTITDILTVTPSVATFVPTNQGLWSQDRFRLINWALCGVLIGIILGRIGSSALAGYWVRRNTPERVLWRQLQQRSLTRAQFYTLAASYLENFHSQTPTPEAAAPILERHWSLSFSNRTTGEAEAVIPGDERTQVLSILRTLS